MKQWALRAARGTTLTILAEVLARAANTIFFILLARQAGSGEFEASIYNLGFAYTSFLIHVSLGGLDQLLNREVARDQNQGAVVLGSFLFARFISSLLCYLGLVLWVIGPAGYDAHVRYVVLILGATIIPDSLISLFQAYLIARDRVRYITILSAVSGGVKLGLGSLFLLFGADASGVAWVVLGTSLVTLVIYFILLMRWFETPRITWQGSFWQAQARGEWPLLLIALMFTIEGSFDVLLLAQSGDLIAVGVYGTAAAVINILLLLPQAYRQIILAIMAESYAVLHERAHNIFLHSNRFLLIISLLIATSLTLSADILLPLVFRGRLASESVIVVQTLVWAFVCTTVMLPHGRLMLVAGHQRWSVPIHFTSMLLNVGMNLLLQPILGPQGAALARVASTGLALVLTVWYVQRYLYQWRLWPVLMPPLVATTTMLGVVILLRSLGFYWLLALVIGGMLYVLVLYLCGGIKREEARRIFDFIRQGTARLSIIVKGHP